MNEMNLSEWSEYVNGARAAAVRLIDDYVRKKHTRADKPYIEAELRYILDSKDNMWRYLQGDGVFHYRNHVKDKKGNVTWCEAFLLSTRN